MSHETKSEPGAGSELAAVTRPQLQTTPGIEFRNTSLSIAESVPKAEAVKIGESIGRAHKTTRWWLGDWVNIMIDRFDMTYEEAAHVAGLKRRTLSTYAWAARHVDPSTRMDDLTPAHHRLVAGLPLERQREMLIAASAKGWSVSELRRQIKANGLIAVEEPVDIMTDAERIEHLEEENERIRSERDEAQILAGTHVRCPRCGVHQTIENCTPGSREGWRQSSGAGDGASSACARPGSGYKTGVQSGSESGRNPLVSSGNMRGVPSSGQSSNGGVRRAAAHCPVPDP
jgi:hypothetical protein